MVSFLGLASAQQPQVDLGHGGQDPRGRAPALPGDGHRQLHDRRARRAPHAVGGHEAGPGLAQGRDGAHRPGQRRDRAVHGLRRHLGQRVRLAAHAGRRTTSRWSAIPWPIRRAPDGKLTVRAVIVDLQTKQDLEKYRGKLKGMAVLATPPVAIDVAALTQGVAAADRGGSEETGRRP